MAQNLGKSILTLGVDGSQMTAGMKKAQGDMAKTGKSAKDLNTNMRFMRGGIGQLGHQFQDIAVQVQGGTDAMIVFGQQGSQIASLFGPGGAVLGAVLAIGAGVAGPLYRALTDATTVMADLAEEAKGAAGAFSELNRIEQQMRKQEVGAAARAQLDELATQRERLEDAVKRHASAMKELNLRQRNGKGVTAELALEVKKQRDNAKEAGIAIHDLKDSLKALFDQVDPDSGAKKVLADVNAQIESIGKTAEQQEMSALRAGGASEAILSEIETRRMLLKTMKADAEFKESLAKSDQAETDAEVKRLQDKFDKEEAAGIAKSKKDKDEAERKRQQQIDADKKALADLNTFIMTKEEKEVAGYAKNLSTVQELLERERITQQEAQSLITGIIEKETNRRGDIAQKAAGKQLKSDQKARSDAIKGVGDQLMALDASNKKVFQMQKAYRMAEATMAAFQGATNALAAPFPFPIPQVMAGAALTLGMANVAQIKAQSFEGGGFTGYGARAGGLDGKGGRMAMVHPNETIVDHRKGGAAGVTIVNNVDARGAGADVDQKIKTAMAQASQQTIMTIQDLKRRGRF
jgi:hypothetical protein